MPNTIKKVSILMYSINWTMQMLLLNRPRIRSWSGQINQRSATCAKKTGLTSSSYGISGIRTFTNGLVMANARILKKVSLLFKRLCLLMYSIFVYMKPSLKANVDLAVSFTGHSRKIHYKGESYHRERKFYSKGSRMLPPKEYNY